MTTNYVLIDFENVQPKNLDMLANHPFKIFVFIGANQTRVPTRLAVAMQPLGDRAQYVEIDGSGRNALDFHIAYYLGELAAGDPAGSYYVISKDKGFDPLIRHLKGRKLKVRRVSDIAEIPNLQISKKATRTEMIDRIVKNLGDRGKARPRKVKTLKNTIENLVQKPLNEQQLESIVNEMKKRNLISVNNGNVKYTLQNY